MANSFLTIAAHSEGLYKDKGSKFLAFAEPVRTEEEIRERLQYYRKEYYDARHVCYAWVLGPDREQSRSSDDGEPSGTAGRPILGRLDSLQLTNVLVVVVRYFGGILLGTGGLVVAYREATADALSHAEIIQRDVMLPRRLCFGYEEMNRVMRTLKDINARIISQSYEGMQCIIECEIEKQYEERI